MIQIEHLSKSFKTADGTVEALKDITLTVPDGEIFGIIGMSGAGKSTLVRCINMLERPTEGKVIIDGCDIGALPAERLREIRRSGESIGKYIQRRRLCEAKRLLAETDNSVRKIAEAVGFPDNSYFCRVFKKETGVTPLTFRAGERKNADK